MKKLVSFLSVFFLVVSLFGQENVVFSEVQHAKEHNVHFETAVLQQVSSDAEVLKNFTNPDEVSFFGNISLDLSKNNVKAMNLKMANLTLELIEVPEYFYDYVIRTSSGERFSANRAIKHYRGIVQNDINSLVAVTFYEDEIMGLVCTSEGNFNIAKDRQSNKIIFYNDKNLKEKMPLTCGTADDGSFPYEHEDLFEHRGEKSSNKKVRFYVETEYDIYQARGSVASVEVYIAGLFNQVAILYQNENIATAISELYIWTSNDPFIGTNTDYLLTQFKYERTSINGDLGILLTFRNIGGGQAAGFSGLCNPATSESLSVAMVSSSYATVPRYSWSVMVVTHELGHLFGSRHTHACVWNGNNTAIDGCAGYVEGNCSLPGNPPEGGTMMSYCHNQSVGINFSLGFGPQPGNVIRNNVEHADCLMFLTLEIMDIRLPEGKTEIVPGEPSDIAIYLKNISNDDASNLTAELTSDSPYLTVNQSTAYYGQLYPEQYKYKTFNVTVSPDTPTGTTEIPVTLTVTDDLGRVMELDALLHFENTGETPQTCNIIENLSAEVVNSDIILSWKAPAKGAPKTYLIYCNDLFLKATTDITYTHANVKLNIYHYCVEALYEDGCTSEMSCVEVITPCNIDIKLTLKSYPNGIRLTWLPKVENVTYKVYRNGELFAEVAENACNDTQLTPNERYCYTVIAVCPANLESAPSNEQCFGGVNIEELEYDIKIYPNPTTGEIKIINEISQIEQIQIFDITGRCLQEINDINNKETTINLSFFADGTYFLQIKTENETFMRKVLKQ